MDLFVFELVNSALLFGSKTLLDNIIYKNCSILEAFNSDFQFSFPVKMDCVFSQILLYGKDLPSSS